jgi:hypothetical protein
VAVTAGWLVGLWFRDGPSAGGIIPQFEIDDIDDSTVGAWTRSTAVEPVAGVTIYTAAATLPRPYRSSFQVRGPGVGVAGALTWVPINSGVNDESFKNGDGVMTAPTVQSIGSSGTAPEYYVFNGSGGFPATFPDLWDLSHSSIDVIPDGESGELAIRLVNGVATIPVNKIILGVPSTDENDTAQLELFWSNDATNTNPEGITDWAKIFQYPDDWRTPTTANADNVVQIQVARKVKWLKLKVTNLSGSSRSISSLLVYAYDNTPIAGTDFVPNLGDANPEFFEVTREGVTMLLTADANSGTSVLTFGQSVSADYDGLAIGQSLWLRSGASLYRYEISAFDAVAKTVTIVGTLNENHLAGEFFDSRALALRLDGYDGNNDKIRETPPLLTAAQWREKWLSKDETLP